MKYRFASHLDLTAVLLLSILLPHIGKAEPSTGFEQFIFDSIQAISVYDNDRSDIKPSDFIGIQIYGHLAGSPSNKNSYVWVKFRPKDGPAYGKSFLLQECLNFARELQRGNHGPNQLIINTKPDPRPFLFFYGPKSSIDHRQYYKLVTSCAYGNGFK